MTVQDLDFIKSVLKDEFIEEEVAVIIAMLNNGELEFSDVFDNDSIEALKAGEEPDIILDIKLLDDIDIMEGTATYYIGVKTFYGSKYDYIVANDFEDAQKCAENEIRYYGENYGLDDFDIDIVDYVDLDYFIDWYNNILKERAIKLLNKPSEMFENELVEYLYEADRLNRWSFEWDENDEPDYKRCTEDNELLIDDYINYNEITNNEVIQTYIDKEGIEAFEKALNSNDIEVNWTALAKECIDQDGIERYLSINNQMDEVEMDGTTYYIFLWHSNDRL